MKDTPLHGFETVVDMWHGTLEYDIRGVFQKPTLIHAPQMMLYHIACGHIRFLHVLSFAGARPGLKNAGLVVLIIVVVVVDHG